MGDESKKEEKMIKHSILCPDPNPDTGYGKNAFRRAPEQLLRGLFPTPGNACFIIFFLVFSFDMYYIKHAGGDLW